MHEGNSAEILQSSSGWASANYQRIMETRIFSSGNWEFPIIAKRKEFIWISKIKSTQNILSLFYPDLQRGLELYVAFHVNLVSLLLADRKWLNVRLVWEQTKMQSFNICLQSGDKVRQEPDHKNHLLLTCNPTHFTAGSVFSKVCSNISRVFWSRIFKMFKIIIGQTVPAIDIVDKQNLFEFMYL